VYISSSSVELFSRRAPRRPSRFASSLLFKQTNLLTKEEKKRGKYACAPRATKSALFISVSDGIRTIFFVVVEQ
jgi:hypothetical protein